MIIDEDPYPNEPELSPTEIMENFQALGHIMNEAGKNIYSGYSNAFKALGEQMRQIHSVPNIQMHHVTEPKRKPGDRKAITWQPKSSILFEEKDEAGTWAGTAFTEEQVRMFGRILNISEAEARETLEGRGVEILPPMPIEPPRGQPSKGPRKEKHFDRKGNKRF